MIKEFWTKMVGNRKSNKNLSRPQQVLSELSRGQGTARQISDRSGIKLSLIRTNMSNLHKWGLIRVTGAKVGLENVWKAVK